MRARPLLLLDTLWALLGPGCQETVELDGLDPRLLLQQDWDRDGIPEALPQDEEGAADYLVDFGPVIQGKSAGRLVLLRNRDGDRETLHLLSVRLDPPQQGFLLDPPPRTELPAGQATFVALYFAPEERIAAEGRLVVETNDPLHPQRSVRLCGLGVAPDVEVCLLGAGATLCNDSVSPRSLRIDFGPREPGELVSQDFEVRNRGDTTLVVYSGGGRGGVDLSFGASLEFSLQPRAWSGELLPEERSRFTISYAPLDGGPDNARVEIASNDPDEGFLVIELSGSGLAPKVCPEPPYQVDFGTLLTGDSAQRAYRLASCGSLPLVFQGLDIEDDPAGVFSLANRPDLPLTLHPGQVLQLALAFSPRTSGAFSGQLHVRSNAEEGFIALLGRARADAACELSALPATLDFGQVSTSGFATKPLTLRNQGTKECQVTGMTGPTGSAAFTVP
ncbi:MAG: choice-of-anchor D domain-containing protein, partial [Myxococcales bacterium]|nr:choice-of-anchor D domain-containing protein [Myxococcales bacterium]